MFDIIEELKITSASQFVDLCQDRQHIVPWLSAIYEPDGSGPRPVYILGLPRIEEVREAKGQGKETVGCGPLKSPANDR